MTHPLLAAMPIDRQRAEIEHSRSALSTWLERPIDTFAYPFGKRGDYSDETIAWFVGWVSPPLAPIFPASSSSTLICFSFPAPSWATGRARNVRSGSRRGSPNDLSQRTTHMATRDTEALHIPVGRVNFGDLRRLTPSAANGGSIEAGQSIAITLRGF